MVPKHRFLADPTLGKLAKWLRILGMDARYVPSGPMEGAIAAAEPGRILLTRSRRIFEQTVSAEKILIRGTDPVEQLKEVIGSAGLRREDLRPFSRCIRCNVSISRVEKASVKTRVPDYVWEQHHRFHQCERCGRIYWAGTHIERSLTRINTLFEIG